MDVKPARGRVKVDSERILAMPGWDFDVIDIDTYGMPWGHWIAAVRNAKAAVTVFLTVGNVTLNAATIYVEAKSEGIHSFLSTVQRVSFRLPP